MKKIENLVFVAGVFLLLFSACPSFAELKIAPYYSLQLTEGAFVPNKGEWNFAMDVITDIGLIAKPSENHSLVGFYELKYLGPGLKRQEGEKFTDRSMDHIGVLRYKYKFAKDYFVKPQVDYMKEYKRTGSNEAWGTGLYDFNRIGGGLSVGRDFPGNATVAVSGQYHFMDFPNYTDLLAQFQAGGSAAESSAGKQNHKLIQAGVTADIDTSRFAYTITFQNYTKQKVAADTVQPGGSYYSSDLQSDVLMNISASRGQEWGIVRLDPSLYYKTKRSNQNYLHFLSATSTEVPTYFGGYYDYDEIGFVVPVALAISKTWELMVSPEWAHKTYKSRVPRGSDGSFLAGEKQRTDMFIISTGITVKPNAITRTTFFYTFQNQKSNMKFEKYLPYNYTGNFVGVRFEYTF